MRFDVFFSICQTEIDGNFPSERAMLQNFFDEVRAADELGFGTAWVAESHLSCEVQKQNPGAVIPNFKGEIGLNTDILQLAHKVYAVTKNISIGSAIRNILCNGGPMAHAETLKTFLLLHGFGEKESRPIHIGFAAGRFPFSNAPYGIVPRNAVEEAAWPVVKNKIFQEATEIFLRFLRGDVFSSDEVTRQSLKRGDFRSDDDWTKVQAASGASSAEIPLDPRWKFARTGVIPNEPDLNLLKLIIGSHDAPTQILANTFLPCGVFNLSITPGSKIEETHTLMQKHFHPAGGPWTRAHMPRTTLVFIDNTPGMSDAARRTKAQEQAQAAMKTYWAALEGTLDPQKIEGAVNNALVGSPADIREQIRTRFHPDDRLMLWFDFFNHDAAKVMESMRQFKVHVAPEFERETARN